MQVDRVRVDGQGVAERAPDDTGTRDGQGTTEPGQVGVQGVADPLRRPVTPGPVDELVDRHGPVRIDEQHSKHTPLPGMTDVDGLIVEMCQALPSSRNSSGITTTSEDRLPDRPPVPA